MSINMHNDQKTKEDGEKLGVLVFPLTEECRLFVEGTRKNPFLNINMRKDTTMHQIIRHILKKFFHIETSKEITNKTSFFDGAGALTANLVVVNRERTSILQVFKQKPKDKTTCASLLEKYPHILEKDTNKIKLFFNLTPSNNPPKEQKDGKDENNKTHSPQTRSPATSSSTSLGSSGVATPITIPTVTTPELHKKEAPKKEITPFFVKKEEEDNPSKKIQIKKVEDDGNNFPMGDPQLSPITPRPVAKQEVEKCNLDCPANENSNSNFFDHSDIFNSRRSFFGFGMDERSLTSLMMEEAEEKRKVIKDEASFFVGSNKIERSQMTFVGDPTLEPHSSKIPKFF